jgi:hypothetical protein
MCTNSTKPFKIGTVQYDVSLLRFRFQVNVEDRHVGIRHCVDQRSRLLEMRNLRA